MLICILSFSLELKNWCSQWSPKICHGNIIFSNIHIGTQGLLELSLHSKSVSAKEMIFMRIFVRIRGMSIWILECSERPWHDAWNAKDSHLHILNKQLFLGTIHCIELLECDASFISRSARSIWFEFETSLYVPVYFLRYPIGTELIYHFEANNLPRTASKEVKGSDILIFIDIIKNVRLNHMC